VSCVTLQVLAPNQGLRRLMLGATNLTGTVPCELFENHELSTLMVSINKLEGSLPACVLEVSGYARHMWPLLHRSRCVVLWVVRSTCCGAK
jgi:hypothetical protein